MFNTNKHIVTNQEELNADVNRQFRVISVCPVLNTFIPGIVCHKHVVSEKYPTACTDGYTVYINPKYWNICNGPQKVGLIFHEMLHCLWLHFYRFRGCVPWVANLATDFVIDRFIRKLAATSKYIAEPPDPPGGYHPRTDEYGDSSEEVIYNDLCKKEDEEQEKDKGRGPGDPSDDDDDDSDEDDSDMSADGEDGDEGDEGEESSESDSGDEDGDESDDGDSGDGDSECDEDGDGSGSGDGEDGEDGDTEENSSGGGGSGSEGEDEDEINGDGSNDPDSKYQSPGGFMQPPDEPPVEEDEEEGDGESDGEGIDKKALRKPEEIMRELRDKWAETQQVIAQTARLKGNIPGGLVEMFEQDQAKLDWVSILANFCLSLSSCDIDEENFDRRFIGDGAYLESIDRPAVENIIFAKDTSGSMWSKWLSTSCSEIQGAMEVANIKRLWVLDIDASMQGLIQEYGPNDRIDFSAKGRGGTDFRPPFEWAKNECPLPPKALIYFTDGYGPFPEEAPDYPVLWMTFGLAPEEYPFGQVIDMRQVPMH
jgi:predicted metal-dependent peptidase